ncbi:hypothetical protein AGMMS49587_03810 [Spirochaetia bacterium]|nr:hypothetical protein AGMMS49587_03810 [Spirochaetia bacterium]
MKKNVLWMLTGLALVSLIAALAFTGCDNGSTSGGLVPDPVDKTALQTALTAADAAKNGTADSLYWVKTDDLTAFETAITAAKTVYDDDDADQAAVDSAKGTLTTATSTFTTTHKKDAGTTDPAAALTNISTAYNGGTGWPGSPSDPASVTIIVLGTIDDTSGVGSYGWLEITGANAYPPIVLQGAAAGGELDADSTYRVLYIGDSNKVTLGANLTLTRGNIESGVWVEDSTFFMTGGTISNSTGSAGGGVTLNGTSYFTMEGGIISGNTGSEGGGVYVSSNSTFIMNSGIISGNTATSTGGGVWLASNADFTKTGGTINGGGVTVPPDNKATTNGHAVYWNRSAGKKKVDGTVSGALSNDNTNEPWVNVP